MEKENVNVKGKREANFLEEEEFHLIKLVEKYKNVIENKATDSINSRKKEATWKQIEKEFNALCSFVFRGADSLKMKYKNILKRSKTSKKKVNDHKKYVKGTGGGEYRPEPNINAVDDVVDGILGPRKNGFDSEYDTDFDRKGNDYNELYIDEDEQEKTVEEEEYDVDNDLQEMVPVEVVDEIIVTSSNPKISANIQIEDSSTTMKNTHADINKIIIDEPSCSKTPGPVSAMKRLMSTVHQFPPDKKWCGNTTALLRTKVTPPPSQCKPGANKSVSSTCPKKRGEFQDQLSMWAKGKQALNSLLEDEHSRKLKLAEDECAMRLQMDKKVYMLKEEKLKLKINHLKIMQEKEVIEKDLDIEIKLLQKRILMNQVNNI